MISKLTLQLPIPDKALSPNARGHWSKKSKATTIARKAAWAEGVRVLNMRKPPKWLKARYRATLFVVGLRFKPDPDNFIASLKAYLDGVADAGIVRNDRDLWPERPEFRQTDKFPRVEITIEPES